ncbi:hypothetical protein MKW92_026247 [Papaver armeniacum]|nr:hypothetical protein MKW92_026247 [Papaver armeniacum]
MDVDSEPSMEETILVGDDLMKGPPSPIIPPEIASHVLEDVETCDGILRNFFSCLQFNDIEPRLILASGAEGMDGKRLESLKQGMEKREKKEEPTSSTTTKFNRHVPTNKGQI